MPIGDKREDPDMENDTGLLRPLMIVFLLAAPAVAQRVLSYFIDDPYLQPLALTVEGLAAAGEEIGDGTWINVQVGWGRDFEGAMTEDRLRGVIAKALAHRTDRFYFVVRDQPGDAVEVSFFVGANRYGPFPPSAMVGGINSALMALSMAKASR